MAKTAFHAPVHDVYCGLRGFTKGLYESLEQRCTGMEFAMEMTLKSSLYWKKIVEVPIALHPNNSSATTSCSGPSPSIEDKTVSGTGRRRFLLPILAGASGKDDSNSRRQLEQGPSANPGAASARARQSFDYRPVHALAFPALRVGSKRGRY
jgi:hypothetical protein